MSIFDSSLFISHVCIYVYLIKGVFLVMTTIVTIPLFHVYGVNTYEFQLFHEGVSKVCELVMGQSEHFTVE